MIIDVDGKRIVFGMDWRSRLSDGDVHKEVRGTKSPFLWHADQQFYYGVLSENDAKEKLKAPLYSGAIAFMNSRPAEQKNIALVLEIPGQGFIVCGIYQSRPKAGFDEIVANEVDVHALLKSFQALCGRDSFELYGDVGLPAMKPLTMEEIVGSLDSVAQLKRVRSGLVSPIVFGLVGVLVLSAGWYGYTVYKKHRAVEAQKAALAATRTSVQLAADELAARRTDNVIAARSIFDVVAPVRALPFSIGGWKLRKATCDIVTADKQMVCKYEYTRKEGGRATYKTFAAYAKQFDAVDYGDSVVKTTKTYKKLPFVEQGTLMDTATPGNETVIEFGSVLQNMRRYGGTKLTDAMPYAIPPGANMAEIDTIPFGSSSWEFSGPLRMSAAIADFPKYVTLSQIIVEVADKPAYIATQSLAMMKVVGTVFSKPSVVNPK